MYLSSIYARIICTIVKVFSSILCVGIPRRLCHTEIVHAAKFPNFEHMDAKSVLY